MKLTPILLSTLLYAGVSTCQAHWNAWDAGYYLDYQGKAKGKSESRFAANSRAVYLCWMSPMRADMQSGGEKAGGGLVPAANLTPTFGYFFLQTDLEIPEREARALSLLVSAPTRNGQQIARLLKKFPPPSLREKPLKGYPRILAALESCAALPDWRFSVHRTHRKGGEVMADSFEIRLLVEITNERGGSELNASLSKLFCGSGPVDRSALATIIKEQMVPYIKGTKPLDPLAIPVLMDVFGAPE